MSVAQPPGSYISSEFCPREGIALDQLKERLRILDATVAAIEGGDFIRLRLAAQSLHRSLCTEQELQERDRWYLEHRGRGYGFETYEPDADKVPRLIRYEQRIRDTGNAFSNFAVDVLKGPTQYTEALSGSRPRASEVGDWLRLDPDWRSPQPESYEARIEQFRNAYVKQTQLRKEAEAKLDAAVVSRMDMQDMLLSGAIARPSSLGAGASANKGEGDDDGAGGGNEDVGIFEYLGDDV